MNTAVSGYVGPGTLSLAGSTLTFEATGGDVAMTDLDINLSTDDDSVVEGWEDYTVSIATPASTTGADVQLDAGNSSVATTIIDADAATWSLTGNSGVTEGASAGYTLSLAGTLQEDETATVDLSISFPAGGPSLDPAEVADFTNAFLADVDTAIAAYGGPGTITRSGNTLTFTATGGDVAMSPLAIGLLTDADGVVEGPEDYTVTISGAAVSDVVLSTDFTDRIVNGDTAENITWTP